MLRLIFMRMVSVVPVVLIVATLVFLLLRLSPGDPATLIAGETASQEQIAATRAHLGLDRPLYVQYTIWLREMSAGRLGTSILTNQSVSDIIASRLEPTFVLAGTAILLTLLIAIPLGILAAWRHNTLTDRAVMALSVFGYSVPSFVIGYLLILGASLYLGLFPVQGYVSPWDNLPRAIHHLILPSITLSIVFMALISRVTRSSMLEVLREDFTRTALAKGATDRRMLWRHALPNASIPIITVIGIGIASLITGVVVTESVFNIPGIGRLTIDAVMSRDYPVVQGLILFFSLIYVGINLLVDLVYIVIDPRIRY